MLNLGVVWDDKSYSSEAIFILRDMVGRNLPSDIEGNFIAFTDFADDLGPSIQKRPLHAERGDTYMLPINCIVVRALDDLVVGKQVKSCFYDGDFPAEAAVVVFHDCHPKDCMNWVQKVYKIGGGSSAEMSYVPNVSKERLMDNMRYSFRKAREWFEPELPHAGVALILGGGPSLDRDIPLILAMSHDSTIFAVNGVPGHVYKHDVRTDIHVMLDAHPDCRKFVEQGYPVKRYYASQCDPSVILAASQFGASLVCWHGGGEAADELASQGYAFVNIVGGGSTAASRAMVLAYGLGFRKFHLFGMDSSHENGKAHAYEQPFSEATLDVTCGDEVFKTSPQLLGQAEDFKLIMPDLIRAACEITVHGDGLLKAVATQMAA